MRLVTPVEGSVCTTHTALMAFALSAARRAPTGGGSTLVRQSPATISRWSDSRPASSRHSEAKWPVLNISTLSPADSVLTSADSHAPVPDAGYMTTAPLVWNTALRL